MIQECVLSYRNEKSHNHDLLVDDDATKPRK